MVVPLQRTIKMSLRAYNTKNERIATGRNLGGKKGFAQFYPAKKAFQTEEEWKSAWSQVDPSIVFSHLDPVEHLAETVVKKMSLVKAPEVSTENWIYKPYHKTIVPPGTYYVGDLCYALPDDLYHKVFGATRYQSGLYRQKGTDNFFFMGGTGGDEFL